MPEPELTAASTTQPASSASTPLPIVRQGSAADAPALALVGAATFLESFAGILAGADILQHCARKHSVDAYRAAFQDAETAAWLAEIESAPVGYALVTTPAELNIATGPGDLELKRIYLLSRFHNTGSGRALMQAAIDHARSQGASRLLLGVYGKNHRAIAFYRRCGFVEAGTRTFHIGAGTYHDLIFALPLRSPSAAVASVPSAR